MNEKERLTEICEDLILSCKANLCTDCEHNKIDYPHCMSVHFADHLLANGVIVPPCKVGDTVYFVYETDNDTMFIDKGVVQSFSYDEAGVWFRAIYENLSSYWHTALSLGETVFLAKAEAEKALAEREQQ